MHYDDEYRRILGKIGGTPTCRCRPTSHYPWLRRFVQFYFVDPPQEFDERGKELSPDAQVWKTYVKEADQVDGELVDGWNKSTDVILIFAALFSAISTAFVIESYKDLKQDPADVSAQTLLIISRNIAAMANESQPTSVSPSLEQAEAPPFTAPLSAIFVNVLWFLSLSLSVAVSLISMLAKEWCLAFMSGRTGPPGPQARRRQQRWNGLVNWKMQEVLMVLPSLIHLSLLLFAIGLCVFLWDVHFGVAIPVMFVTTIAAGVYVGCTILPFMDDYCPYGTVLSRLYKRFMSVKLQVNNVEFKPDEVTVQALQWMVANCETPRSVDVAFQSLAGLDGDTTRDVMDMLDKQDVWALIKQKLGSEAMDSEHNDPRIAAYSRALQSVTKRDQGLSLGSNVETQRLEALIMGLQSSINK
ncbi:hypothetical protein RSOLAG22IIIB_06673 [Rhizoctonia solani]|uniref:DUF6535 domain-containing protein n=1 Tax=Rhizoctonia solani TaxID=456999 RepID=A0A0K6GFG4_9AGAM|nr:hypothetical protein RSOLAG22IIIB_06673 [Rhizoctonia solani]